MKQIYLEGIGLTLEQKVADGIKLLQEFESSALEYSPDGYYLCFSGGKDSVVIKDMAIKSGVKFQSHYSVTTIDPPELTRFIKHYHPDVIWHRPKLPMMKMVLKNGLPTRKMRWCCKLYKENGGEGLVKIMGIRAAESPSRAKAWDSVTAWHGKQESWCVNPILYFSNEQVWEYIKTNNIPYCELYDSGMERLGCVGCPMNRKRERDFKRWPHMEGRWRRAARERWGLMTEKNRAYRTYKNADEWFDWWKSNTSMPDENDCQMGLF